MARKDAIAENHDGTVPATEFCKNFGRFRDEATAGGMVKVSSHGRVVGAFISTAELERFETLKHRERQVYRVEDMPEELAELIAKSEYGKPAE